MTLNLLNAPENVIENLNNANEMWQERCQLIQEFEHGDYSRHLLLVLTDLYEEIKINKNFFSNNIYGQKFFEIQLSNYCHLKNKSDALNNIKQKWAVEVNQELDFIREALSHSNKFGGRFGLEDVLLLIQRIEEKITSVNSLEIAINLLTEKIFQEKPEIKLVEFLIDTIILLFHKKGFLSIKNLFERQLESFENIYFHQDVLYPKLWGAPSKDDKSTEEYRQEIKVYYDSLGIRERLLCFKEMYCRDSQYYKVIFNTLGIKLLKTFRVGDVHFYNPTKDGRYLKEHEYLNFENAECCIAVSIQGTDSASMKIKAKHMAERAIAGLSTRSRKEQPISLSDNFLICDSEGKVQSFTFSHRANTEFNIVDSLESQNFYSRLGRWISSADTCNSTVIKWLTSIELQRQATESLQSPQELLNAWFAVEKFSEESRNISIRLPELSEPLKKINNIKETFDIWIKDENVRSVQLILVLSELKFQIYKELSNSAIKFCRPSILFYEIELSKYIPQKLLDSFYDNESINIPVYLEKLPEIKQELENRNVVLPIYIKNVYDIFYDNNICERYIFEKIIELKDDIYNIYRIRNMLVHSSNTQSKLLEYYANRIREYSFSFLSSIGNKLLKTLNDDEIKSLDFYFRELVIDSNIALEAVKDNKMDKFTKWILAR